MDDLIELWVCMDCHHANHGYEPENGTVPWSLFESTMNITDNTICSDCHLHEMDCEHGSDNFSKTPCDGCGSQLAGARYRYAQHPEKEAS